MKTIDLKLNGASRRVLNLEVAFEVSKTDFLTHPNLVVGGTVIYLATLATVNYAYDVVRSLLIGLASVSATTVAFKKYEDYDAAATAAATAQDEGGKYYDSEEAEMYTNTKVEHHTLDEGEATTVNDFTFVAAGEDPDLSEASEGDLYFLQEENLFYEVEIVEEEKQLTPTEASADDLYHEVNSNIIYSYEDLELHDSLINYSEETPSAAEVESAEIGTKYYVAEDEKVYEVIETEVLELVKDATIQDAVLWKDTNDSNKLYDYVDGDMEAFDAIDLTNYASGSVTINEI